MKFTKTWKRFWTLNRHHAAGFTLVELIVVIAILAILAGIAVPAYSGYINKAKEAGDYTLLSAINTAFAAACIENGQAAAGQGTVGITGYQKDSAEAITIKHAFNGDFQLYLGDSKSSNFEIIGGLYYDNPTGTFKAVSEAYLGLLDKFTGPDKDAYVNSVFYGMGAESLLGEVGGLTGFGAALIGSEGSSFYELVYGTKEAEFTGDTTYMQNLAAKMGYTDWENEEVRNEFFADLAEMANGDTAQMNQILANGAVLSAANKTADLKTGFLTSDNLMSTIQSNLEDPAKAEEGLAQASMAYAMYLAYANSDYVKDNGITVNVPKLEGVDDVTELTTMLGDMNSEGFKAYMATSEGTNDLNGYKASMNMVNESAQDEDALRNVLKNGFDDPELIGIMNSVVGTK